MRFPSLNFLKGDKQKIIELYQCWICLNTFEGAGEFLMHLQMHRQDEMLNVKPVPTKQQTGLEE